MKVLGILIAFFSFTCFSTPLINAVVAKNSQEVKRLVDMGTEVNELNEKQETALMHAAWIGLVDIIEILLNAGANPLLISNQGGNAKAMAQQAYENEKIFGRAFFQDPLPLERFESVIKKLAEAEEKWSKI